MKDKEKRLQLKSKENLRPSQSELVRYINFIFFLHQRMNHFPHKTILLPKVIQKDHYAAIMVFQK